jgi:hypothetical protein
MFLFITKFTKENFGHVGHKAIRAILFLSSSILLGILIAHMDSVYKFNSDNTSYSDYELDYENMEYHQGGTGQVTTIILFLIIISMKFLMDYFYSETYGVFLQIITSMFVNAFQLLVVFFIVILIFAVAGNALFSDLDEFRTFHDAIFTLYQAALGDFSVSLFEDAQYTEVYIGKIYIIVFLLIYCLLFVNYLIAIFSDSNEALSDKKIGMKMNEIILGRQCYVSNDGIDRFSKSPQGPNIIQALICVFCCTCCKKHK